jgi:hypothetical protein
MANEHENLAAKDLVVQELDQPYEVTEEDATLVAIACTCTCDIPWSSDAAPRQVDASVSIDAATASNQEE